MTLKEIQIKIEGYLGSDYNPFKDIFLLYIPNMDKLPHNIIEQNYMGIVYKNNGDFKGWHFINPEINEINKNNEFGLESTINTDKNTDEKCYFYNSEIIDIKMVGQTFSKNKVILYTY
jgi:hypothetical protein